MFSGPVMSNSETPWTAARQASFSLTISQSLPKFMFIRLVMPSSHLILWHPLLFLSLIFPSIRDFSNELSLRIRWPKYWSFSFSISPSSEYSGLISLKIDWFDFPAVQGTFRSLLQHHSSKASILWRSAFFTVQLSCDHFEDHSLDYIRPLLAEWCLCFSTHCLGLSLLSCQEAIIFWYTAVTIHSDFGAQEEEICHYFHLLSILKCPKLLIVTRLGNPALEYRSDHKD